MKRIKINSENIIGNIIKRIKKSSENTIENINKKGEKRMPKNKIYIVSFKRYGNDSYCGCEFHPLKAFKNEEDARKYAEQDEEYDYDEIELEEK